MASGYYKDCDELRKCLEIDKKYWDKSPVNWFSEYLKLAEATTYPLAECQVGYAYLEGIGIEKDFEKGLYWTALSAEHGDRDAQFNLGQIYEEGYGVEKDLEKAKYWYKKSALQHHDLALDKCSEYGIDLSCCSDWQP